MAQGLICTCTLVEKTAKPGGEGIYRYTYECTWNEGDTNRYTISVDGTSDELAARVKAQDQTPYENPKDKGS
jgi:hypothetical protein